MSVFLVFAQLTVLYIIIHATIRLLLCLVKVQKYKKKILKRKKM